MTDLRETLEEAGFTVGALWTGSFVTGYEWRCSLTLAPRCAPGLVYPTENEAWLRAADHWNLHEQEGPPRRPNATERRDLINAITNHGGEVPIGGARQGVLRRMIAAEWVVWDQDRGGHHVTSAGRAAVGVGAE